MSKLKETQEKIRRTVTGSYQKIEDTVVDSYIKVENGVLGSYQKIEDAFIDTFLRKDGETTEEARSRITARDREEA